MLDTTSTAIARRATVEDIVAHRNRALALYADAHVAIAAASIAVDAAKKEGAKASPGVNRYNYHNDGKEKSFLAGIKIPERDKFLAAARKLVDTDVWAHVIQITDLERLMDKRAKDQLNQQLLVDPPEATVPNIMATLEQFLVDADMIFKRGIAECFSNLDRRFRSHDGWKIRARVVLHNALNECGTWSYYSNQRDTMRDIERTFMVLDGEQVPSDYAGVVGKIEYERRGHHGRRQGYVETEYFRVRTFMNGNCHIWFKRDDLLERVNQLLGEYYGAAIPEDRDADEDTGLHTPKTAVAKNYGFFPTPAAVAKEVMERADLWRDETRAPLRVLEPSAGTGALAALAAGKGCVVDCVEMQPTLADVLSSDYVVHCCDFLSLRPETIGLYDRVVLNPPFDRDRDIDHVVHAMKFLKPDGKLVAVMSAGTEFRDTRKATAFREMMEKKNARWRDLPAGSFSSVGTNVNTVLVSFWADGRRDTW